VAGQHITVALALPRTPRPAGRYVSLWIGAPVGPAITLSPSSLPNGQTGTAYSATLTATGAASPYTFDLASGTLPAGLTLSSAGVLSGSPTASVTLTFTARATDSTSAGLGGPYVGVRSYTVTILPPPFRGLVSSVGMSWTRQAVVQQVVCVAWDTSRVHFASLSAGWARSAIIDRILSARWGQIPAHTTDVSLPWDKQAAQHRAIAAGWAERFAIDASTTLPWDMPPALAASIDADWTSPPPVDIGLDAPWTMLAPLWRAFDSPWTSPPYKHREFELPWGQGRHPPWLVRPPDEIIPPPPPPGDQSGRHISLRFACPRRTESARHLSLPLGPWQCYTGRLQPKVITVTNSVTIVRTPDNAPIVATGVTVRGDLDSPMWTVQLAGLDAASLALLTPGPSGEPRRIRVTINGHAWTFLVEGFSEATRFGQRQRTANGRSLVAVLTRDYAPARTRTQTSARNADQLADEELADTGYTVDWQGPTWLVPGGLWSYADLAPLDALRSIAEACGCVLQAHQTDPVVRVIPAFRARPWVWATTAPDVDIVDDYVLERSTGTAMGVRHNGVEVRGETTGGIRGEVEITGTAGAIALPQVSHPLITAYAAAESRGIYELSKIGPIGRVGIELPLFGPSTEPGLVLPGMLPRLSGTLMTRALGVTIQAAWTDGGGLVVRQSLELERHFDA
jgi:hypothetical protein